MSVYDSLWYHVAILQVKLLDTLNNFDLFNNNSKLKSNKTKDLFLSIEGQVDVY